MGPGFGLILSRCNRSATDLGDDRARCGGGVEGFTPRPRPLRRRPLARFVLAIGAIPPQRPILFQPLMSCSAAGAITVALDDRRGPEMHRIAVRQTFRPALTQC